MQELDFYFDIVSPYAFLAWQAMHEIKDFQGVLIHPKPVFLGGMLRSINSLGPAEVPLKRQWVYQDVTRTAKILDLDFQFPPQHPFLSLLAMRALTYVAQHHADKLQACTQAMFDASWRRQRDLAQWSEIAACLHTAGLEFEETSCQTQAVKDALKASGDAALQQGIFGVPTIVYQGENFWGHDRLGHVVYCLKNGDILSAEDKTKLQQIPSGIG